VPRSTPYRLGRLDVTTARRVGSSSTARCFATLPSRNSRLFAREFVRRSFLVCRASTLGSDCALRLRIHCRKSAWRLATDAAGASRVCSDFRSCRHCFHRPLHCFRFARPFVPLGCWAGPPLSISLPRYSSFELEAVAGRHRVSGDSVGARPRLHGALMRKQQAAISGRGRTAGHPVEIVDFFSPLTCVTPYLTGTVFWEPSRAGARRRVWRVLSTLGAAPKPLRRR